MAPSKLPRLTDKEIDAILHSSSSNNNGHEGTLLPRYDGSPKLPVVSNPHRQLTSGINDDDKDEWLPPMVENKPRAGHCVTNDTHSFSMKQHPHVVNGTHQHNPSTNNTQYAYLQKLVTELRGVNSNQTETITGLKIKVAVLESELKRADQDKDSVTKSLGIVIETLTRFSSSHSNNNQPSAFGIARLEDKSSRVAVEHNINALKDLGAEVEQLRKTNKRLTRELKERDDVRKRGRSSSPDEVHHKPDRRQGRQFGVNHSGLPAASRKSGFHLENWQQASINDPPPILKFETESSRQGQQTLHLGEDFLSTPTTISNTPTNPAQPPGLNQVIEFRSLEDLFADDTDDEEVQEKKRERDKYFSTPAPGVIKTETETKGTYMGTDSEFAMVGKAPWSGKWGGLRPQQYLPNQFAPPTLRRQYSSLLTDGSGVSKDKSNDSTLWSSPTEREIAIEIHQRFCGTERRFPDLFKHGIQFRPSKNDSNYFRTLTISNIPRDVELRDILAQVRGGEILSSVLCDTYSLTGGMTVRLVFKREDSTTVYLNFCTVHPLTFSSELEPIPRTAVVTLVDTPTYPAHHVRLNEQSRCLKIHDFPQFLSTHELQRDIACHNKLRVSTLMEIWIDKERSLHLEFSSISAAGSVYGILGHWQAYRELRCTFWDDPCAGPVEELLSEPQERLSKPSFTSAELDVGYDLNASFCKRKRQERDEQRILGQERRNSEAGTSAFQRRQLVALTNQKVDIPELSEKGIGGPSWADEVIEELESPSDSIVAEPVSTPSTGNATSSEEDNKKAQPILEESLLTSSSNGSDHLQTQEESFSSDSASTLILSDVNRLMADKNHKIWKDRKPPTGLAGSKYATLVLTFADKDLDTPHSSGTSRRSENGNCSGEDLVVNHNPEDIKHHRAHVLEERPTFGVRSDAENDEVTQFLNLVNAETFASDSDTASENGKGGHDWASASALEGLSKISERRVEDMIVGMIASSQLEKPDAKVLDESGSVAKVKVKEQAKNPDEIDLDSESESESKGESESGTCEESASPDVRTLSVEEK